MSAIKNVMVCLDLTEMDELLIQYTNYLCNLLTDIRKVYFVHNIRFNNQEAAKEILAKLDKPLGEIVAETIAENVEQNFDADQRNIAPEIIVEEGDSTPSMLAKHVKPNQIDLIVVGKKISYKGSGLVVEKLLRVAPSDTSVLLVPETAYHQLQNILVPIDFSKASKSAILKSVYLKKQVDAHLSCQHVFSVPSFYFPTMVADDLKSTLKKQAEKRWQKYTKEIAPAEVDDIYCELSFNWEKNIVQTIYDHAVRSNKDLIVMASKGRSAIASFAIGSTAMQMVKCDLHIPLLIVKHSN